MSEGCQNCYAEGIAARFSQPGQPYEGLAKHVNHEARWTGEISFHEDILLKPLSWKKPRRVFVNSMSDLFHEKVADEWLDKAFAMMALTPQHTYQILTKRPERMLEYFTSCNPTNDEYWPRRIWQQMSLVDKWPDNFNDDRPQRWPLKNVWLGVSVEDQKTADERIPLLLQTPAAVRWISAEPLLEGINFRWQPYAHQATGESYREYLERTGEVNHLESLKGISWVVVGGESGPGARPFNIQWARDIIAQCKAADVPVFMKQLGAKPVFPHDSECIDPAQAELAEDFGLLHDATTCACRCHERLLDNKGGDMNEWPEDLRIREMPETR